MAHLLDTMHRYTTDVKKLWDNEMRSFIESSDCHILEKLISSDCDQFINFMCEQKTYRLMMTSLKRLAARRAYLVSNV